MYAIIETGGKQYRVREGDVIRVESLPADESETVVFDRVLMLAEGENVNVGSPVLPDCRVTGTVIRHGKSDKVIVFKYKPKTNYRRKRGHRQHYTEVRIEKIAPEAQ